MMLSILIAILSVLLIVMIYLYIRDAIIKYYPYLIPSNIKVGIEENKTDLKSSEILRFVYDHIRIYSSAATLLISYKLPKEVGDVKFLTHSLMKDDDLKLVRLWFYNEKLTIYITIDISDFNNSLLIVDHHANVISISDFIEGKFIRLDHDGEFKVIETEPDVKQ